MLTEKDYYDYDTCVALKELGYDGTTGECSHFGAFHMNGKEIFYDRLYNSELKENECLRVPLYLAQKWLREEKKIIIEVKFYLMYKGQPRFSSRVLYNLTQHQGAYYTFDSVKKEDYDSFEEALLEGIKEAIKVLKNNGKAN